MFLLLMLNIVYGRGVQIIRCLWRSIHYETVNKTSAQGKSTVIYKKNVVLILHSTATNTMTMHKLHNNNNTPTTTITINFVTITTLHDYRSKELLYNKIPCLKIRITQVFAYTFFLFQVMYFFVIL